MYLDTNISHEPLGRHCTSCASRFQPHDLTTDNAVRHWTGIGENKCESVGHEKAGGKSAEINLGNFALTWKEKVRRQVCDVYVCVCSGLSLELYTFVNMYQMDRKIYMQRHCLIHFCLVGVPGIEACNTEAQ